MSRLWIACVCLAALAGCPGSNDIEGQRDGDPVLYAEEVQPVVRRHCAFQGCHGREGMPLTLYAVDFLRLRDPQGDVDGERPELDERRLSEGELEHNRRALAARTSAADPTGERMIRRMLGPEDDGIPHGDVVVFERRDDPDLITFESWLTTIRAR